MGKLHELLAVESDLKAKAQHALAQVKGLFTTGQGKFVGQVRKYQPFNDDGERLPDEITVLATSVDNELETVKAAVSQWLDASLQKEVTNQGTSADVIVNGVKILTELPATALLNLEGKLAEIRQLYQSIPTNDPAERWNKDAQLGHYVSEVRETRRTKKVQKVLIKYEATKEHPAQTEAYAEDIPVGTWSTTIHSGQVSPTEKNTRLERLDALIMAVKKARQRANDIEIKDVHAGEILFKYINGV